MIRDLQGRPVRTTTVGEPVDAFIPSPLPPQPAVEMTPALTELLDRAHVALGRLDGVTTILPDPSLFLYFYIRKEAVLSSQIEGTQSSLSDLLLFENEETPSPRGGDAMYGRARKIPP